MFSRGLPMCIVLAVVSSNHSCLFIKCSPSTIFFGVSFENCIVKMFFAPNVNLELINAFRITSRYPLSSLLILTESVTLAPLHTQDPKMFSRVID